MQRAATSVAAVATARDRRLRGPFYVTMLTSGAVLTINFFTGMATARVLGANGRGEFAAITAWIVMGSYICSIGFAEAMEFVSAKRSDLARQAAGTALVAVALLSVLAALLLQLLLPLGLRAQSAHTLSLARWATLWLPAAMGMPFVVALLAGRQRFYLVNVANLLQPLLFGAGLAALAVTRRFHVDTVLLAFFLSYLGVCVFGLGVLRARSGLGRPSWAVARPGLGYGIRLLGAKLGALANAGLDVMVLPAFVVASDVAHYAIAVSVATIVVGLLGNLASIVFPAASRRNTREGVALVERTTRVVLAGATVVATFLFVTGPALIRLVYGPEFDESALMLRLLLPGTVLWSAASVVNSGLQALDLPGKASRAQLNGVAVTVVCLAVTIPLIGAVGAAVTSSLAYAVTFATAVRSFSAASGVAPSRIMSPRRMVEDVRWLRRRSRRTAVSAGGG